MSSNLTASAKYKSQVIDFTWFFCFIASSVCHLVCHQTLAVAECCEMELDAKRHTCEMSGSAAHSLPMGTSHNPCFQRWALLHKCRSQVR